MPLCTRCGGWISALVYECPACGEKPKGPPPVGLVASDLLEPPSGTATGRKERPEASRSRAGVASRPASPRSAPPADDLADAGDPDDLASDEDDETDDDGTGTEPFLKAPGPTQRDPEVLGNRPAPRQSVPPRPAARRRRPSAPGAAGSDVD